MSESRFDEGAVSLPFQGPHWRANAGGPALPEVVPLRLCLRPGRFAVEVTRSGMIFGRHSTADVRLPLPDVSRRHCRFEYEDGRWQVIDLDSLNGIFVNNVLVERAELHDRDTLRIGGFVFDVDLRAGERTVQLADHDREEYRRAS
jgi:predicted component of type VI protein secretion system